MLLLLGPDSPFLVAVFIGGHKTSVVVLTHTCDAWEITHLAMIVGIPISSTAGTMLENGMIAEVNSVSLCLQGSTIDPSLGPSLWFEFAFP